MFGYNKLTYQFLLRNCIPRVICKTWTAEVPINNIATCLLLIQQLSLVYRAYIRLATVVLIVQSNEEFDESRVSSWVPMTVQLKIGGSPAWK